jgi:hypothetical protein
VGWGVFIGWLYRGQCLLGLWAVSGLTVCGYVPLCTDLWTCACLHRACIAMQQGWRHCKLTRPFQHVQGTPCAKIVVLHAVHLSGGVAGSQALPPGAKAPCVSPLFFHSCKAEWLPWRLDQPFQHARHPVQQQLICGYLGERATPTAGKSCWLYLVGACIEFVENCLYRIVCIGSLHSRTAGMVALAAALVVQWAP